MTHIIYMLTELNWMTVIERADFHSTCLIYKGQNNLAPQYLVDHFKNTRKFNAFGISGQTILMEV